MFLKLWIFTLATFLLVQVSKSAPPGVEWYHFGLIADMDKKSISPSDRNTFNSILKIDELRHNTRTGRYNFVISRVKKPVSTRFGYKGRGAELSEILIFNKQLYTFDDKTGIVFRMTKDGKLIPWVVLANGDGKQPDGFKAEWATVKNDKIYVGSTGITFKDEKGNANTQSLWVKEITKDGSVTSHDWSQKYKKIREAMKLPEQGFVWHEAVIWSQIRKEWIFLPRKCSHLAFTPSSEEASGCNLIITADEKFQNIKVIPVRDHPAEIASGFSAFKFIPGTNNEKLLALRTIEQGEKIATYAVVIDMEGNVLMPERKLYDEKYEGVAFFGGVKKNKFD
uniref:Apyrase n=1 Tax=Lutzomyia ayacuchensis TaxID=252632 RepID=L0MYE0_LUTAY|nr:putative apyrase [Lutzomyia ayacuchensis]